MASVYSTQLINTALNPPFTDQIEYTTPAGVVVVVTSIDYYVQNTAANQESWVRIAPSIFLYHKSAAAEQINFTWRGAQVMNTGQKVKFTANGLVATVAVTGYVLPI